MSYQENARLARLERAVADIAQIVGTTPGVRRADVERLAAISAEFASDEDARNDDTPQAGEPPGPV